MAHEFGGILEFELVLDVAAVDIDRLGTEVQLVGDHARAVALSDELKDLELPITQFFDRRLRIAGTTR